MGGGGGGGGGLENIKFFEKDGRLTRSLEIHITETFGKSSCYARNLCK